MNCVYLLDLYQTYTHIQNSPYAYLSFYIYIDMCLASLPFTFLFQSIFKNEPIYCDVCENTEAVNVS